MKKIILFYCLLVLSASNLLSQQNDIPKNINSYLSQELEGMAIGNQLFDSGKINKTAFRINEEESVKPYVGNKQESESSRKIFFRLKIDIPGKLSTSYCKGEYFVHCGKETLISGQIEMRDLSTDEKRVFEKEVNLPEQITNAEEITWRFRGELYDAGIDKKFEPMVMSVEKWDETMEGIGYDIIIGANGNFSTQKKVYKRTSNGSLKLEQKTANLFAPLQGPFKVGVKTYFWTDSQREEIFTTKVGDKRHLFVQVWYPADEKPNAQIAKYVQHPEIYGPIIRKSDLINIPTNAYLNVPLSKGKSSYPVILYSHGFNANAFSGTFLVEQLASYGYVVFSISHTFFNAVETFPDGYRVLRDFFPKMDEGKSQDEGYQEFGEFMQKYTYDPYAQDAQFVLKQIEKLNKEDKEFFRGRLDLTKIGMCGWSAGGVNAAQLCNLDSRIKAGINFDGTMSSRGVKNQPFLIMKSDPPPPEDPSDEFKNMIERIRQNESTLISNSSHIYHMVVKGAIHTNFSDLPLYDERLTGSINTKNCHELTINITRAFFDRYVLDQKEIDLEKLAKSYPEIQFKEFK